MLLHLEVLTILLCTVTLDKAAAQGSVGFIQVQDDTNPREFSNAYIVMSSNKQEGFFVDTGATLNTTMKLIALYQRQVQSVTKPPLFVFITHGHPDHTAGLWFIQQVYPSTPIYVMSQQIVVEAKRWNNLICSLNNNNLTEPRCRINLDQVLRVLTQPHLQLMINDPTVNVQVVDVIAKGESSYASMLAVTTTAGVCALFTGDALTIRQHMFISNSFESPTLPSSDDVLCAWAGTMKTIICDYEESKYQLFVFPGHGPVSGRETYINDVLQNLAWLRQVRRLTFNSCNATYVWNEMIRQFPDFGGRRVVSAGSLSAHVPNDANSVGCNCNNGLPTVCPISNSPPTCVHLDRYEAETTLSCHIRRMK